MIKSSTNEFKNLLLDVHSCIDMFVLKRVNSSLIRILKNFPNQLLLSIIKKINSINIL